MPGHPNTKRLAPHSAADQILEAAEFGILTVDGSGQIHYANPAAHRLLAAEPGGLRGRTLIRIHKNFANSVAAAFSKGKPAPVHHFRDIGPGIELHISMLTQPGEVSLAVCRLSSLGDLQQSAQKLPGTARSQADLELQFNTIFDFSSYGIWILDGAGKVLNVNAAAEKLVGIDAKDILGKNITALVDKGVIDKALTPSILVSKKPVSQLLYVYKTEKHILSAGTPVLDEEGNVILVVVCEHDLTMVRDLRQQLEQSRDMAEKIKDELSERNLLELKDQEIIAHSEEMRQILKILLKLARLDISNILLTGESGTGKGLMAKFIHQNSRRHSAPFIQINCAALPETLLEAELFGYEKGAFTGAADSGKAGHIELADGGTLFLDEIGDLPFSVQAKLLKYLDEGDIMRLGGTRTININCTVVAATNHDLEALVLEKKFRRDLFFRLNAFPVKIPPLRRRPEDVFELAQHYLAKYNREFKQNKRFSERTLEHFQNYPFPGNVRELKNIVKNAVVVSEKPVLDVALPSTAYAERDETQNHLTPAASSANDIEGNRQYDLSQEILEHERKRLRQALRQCHSTREMAWFLGISQSTVVRKLKKHGLSIPKPRL